MADQPDWLRKIPFDVLNLIAHRTREPLLGLTTFRSVCRTWRAAVGPAPRLLPPSPQDPAVLHAGSDHMLVFPLSSGWSIVVDPRDISGHLSHLATGAKAALPNLNALCDGGDTSKITHLHHYSHTQDLLNRVRATLDVDRSWYDWYPDDQSTDQEAYSSDAGSACDDQNEYEGSACEDRNVDSVHQDYDDDIASSLELDKGSATCEVPNEYYLADVELPYFKEEGSSCEDQDDGHLEDQEAQEDRRHKIKTYSLDGHEYNQTYISFSNHFRFAIHVPPSTQAGSSEGIVIMMFHRWLHDRTNGMVFCRPGDATWTIISNPNPEDGNFVDFAYFDGKMFAMNQKCVTLVFDVTTLNILCHVDVPPETVGFFSKLCGGGSDAVQSLHLLELPHKLLLVKVFMGQCDYMNENVECKPVDFQVFELRDQSRNGQLAWYKVAGQGVGGNYELFMDSYHATFSNSGDGRGTRIYHADNELFGNAHCVWGYCYNMHDNKLECIHEPAQDDHNEYSTKLSWFVP